MKSFLRLMLCMTFVALGCSQAEFLYAAQPPQPHKRKVKEEADEESISKKPREEEKTDADREEKEMGDFPRAPIQADIEDSDEDHEYVTSSAVEAIASEVRDDVIRLFLSCPCSSDEERSKEFLLKCIKSAFLQKGINPTLDERLYLYEIIKAHLTDIIYPSLFHFFELYVVSNTENRSLATPGEISELRANLGSAYDTTSNIGLAFIIVVTRIHRSSVGAELTESIAKHLRMLGLTYSHCSYLSDISPMYKKLFMRDDPKKVQQLLSTDDLLLDQNIVGMLINSDIEVIQKFIQDDNKRLALIGKVSACAGGCTVSDDYKKLVNFIGDFRYRFYNFKESFDFSFNSLLKINFYRDVIESYASADIKKNNEAGAIIDEFGRKLGLIQPTTSQDARLRDFFVISSFCNEVWKKFNTFSFSERLNELSRSMMQFEIRYAGKVDQAVIDDLKTKKEELLSGVSKLKITTFKAYTKALHRLYELSREIIVNRDLIASSQALLDHAFDNDGICRKLAMLSNIEKIRKPITISYRSDHGVDHVGINRTMNTELARSFLGDSFFSSNGRFALPKLFNELTKGKEKCSGIFSAIGSWLSIIFVNNIAVPLPLPEVFYAALKGEDLKCENRETLIKLAEYLKSYDAEGFNDHYREFFRIFLYGSIDQIKEYCHTTLGWEKAQYADFTDQNKIHKAMHEIILPIFSLEPEDKDYRIGYFWMQNGGLWTEAPIQYQDYLVDFFNNLIAHNPQPINYERIRIFFPRIKDQVKGLLINLFQWLSPYDLVHFFPQSINVEDLAAHLEFNNTDLGNDPMLNHAADIFEKALREYINENRDNQEKLQNLVGYFTGSPVYGGHQLKIHFSINQRYSENAHTCYTTVDVNLRMVDAQGALVVDRSQDCQQLGDEVFKNNMKELIATWHGNEQFSLEQQLQHQAAAAQAQAALQPI